MLSAEEAEELTGRYMDLMAAEDLGGPGTPEERTR
jgi:hypothetical protein